MKKTALLVVLVLVPVVAIAQTSTAPADPTTQTPSAASEKNEAYRVAPARPPEPATMPPSGGQALPPGVTPDSLKAPEPGHPLNPSDVLTLTGKDKEYQRQGYQPQVYYNYGMPYYGSPNPFFNPYGYSYRGTQIPLLSGGGILSGGSPLDSTPRFAPLLFGNAGGSPFFILGDLNRPNLRTPFFFPGVLVAPFTPVSPFFTFGNFVRPMQFGTRMGSTTAPATRSTTPQTPRTSRQQSR